MPNGTDDQVGFFCPQSKHTWRRCQWMCSMPRQSGARTLLAVFALSFSKIFCDSVLVARAMMGKWYRRDKYE